MNEDELRDMHSSEPAVRAQSHGALMLPFISVVIPTYGRPGHIRRCVGSFLSARYPHDRFEILVVDDGSPEPLRLGALHERLPLRCVRQDRGGPARARNFGLTLASGDLIAFTDDDCCPADTWLPSLAAAWAANPAAAFAGPVRNALRHNPASEATQILIDYCIRYFDPPGRSRGFFTSNNMAFPADLLRSAGAFHSGFPFAGAEDREVCARWFDRGHRFRFVPEAVVNHYHDLSFGRFVRQHFRYGRGACLYNRVRAAQANESLKVESWRFYAGMLASPFDGRPVPESVGITCLIALSQCVTAAGFFYEQRRSAQQRQPQTAGRSS